MKPINTCAVLRNIRLVLRTRDISRLNKTGYDFLNLMNGFIAHYDLCGFRDYYEDVDDLVLDIAESADLAEAERYITDSFYMNEDVAYYHSKYETLAGMRKLVATYPYATRRGRRV